jgi:hypothetical protein
MGLRHGAGGTAVTLGFLDIGGVCVAGSVHDGVFILGAVHTCTTAGACPFMMLQCRCVVAVVWAQQQTVSRGFRDVTSVWVTLVLHSLRQ